jgi:TonB family protein
MIRTLAVALLLASCTGGDGKDEAAGALGVEAVKVEDSSGATITLNPPARFPDLPGMAFAPKSTLRVDKTYSEDDASVQPPVIAMSEDNVYTMVEMCVDETGTPNRVSVIVPSGREALDKAAIKIATNARFRPARKGGEAVAYCGFVLPIPWTLPVPVKPQHPPAP